MKMAIYKQQDLIPLTISVLGDISYLNACFTLKYLVETEFSDLKGLICTDMLDESSIALLDSVDNDLHHVTYESMLAIYDTVQSLANIYGMEVEKIFNDERLNQMGEDFVGELIIDDFPHGNCLDEDGNPEPAGSLDLFALSLVNVVHFLCSLLSDGKVDFDLSWDPDHFYIDFLGEDYSGKEHAVALKLLQELGMVLNANHLKIIDIIYPNDVFWDDP
jgi:hypothetical protein